MTSRRWGRVGGRACLAFALAACPSNERDAAAPRWRLVYHETFDAPLDDSAPWVEDTYAPGGPYDADAVFGDDGAFFHARGGATFAANLAAFRSFRRAIPYGRDHWLTVELYARDADADGVPEGGGRVVVAGGKATVVSARHYDAAIVRSTRPLPPRYRVEVTVSNIAVGANDPRAVSDPWGFTDESPAPEPATQNGIYFLCITDYPRPAPHNNVFIHHHRKVVMDTDDNLERWSSVWDPRARAPVACGSRYVSMIWLDGETWGKDWIGNQFTSWTPGGWQRGPVFADQYLPGETYVFAIERDADGYAMSVSGRFVHGGTTTYRARRGFRERPVTWHYNQTAAEYGPDAYDETKTFGGATIHTWPRGSAYPDFFFFGDPHINDYAASATYDDVKLYVPE